MSSIAVIGGGIVGASCALRLARAGHEVTLFNAGTKNVAASWGNAGHIAIEQVAPLASPHSVLSLPSRLFFRGGPVALPPAMIGTWGRFAFEMLRASTPRRFAEGKQALETLLGHAEQAWQRLAEDIGDPSLLRLDGHFVAWESNVTAEVGRARWAESGTGSASFRDATAAELDLLKQQSPKITHAIRFTGTGQIEDLQLLAQRLTDSLESSGVKSQRETAGMRMDADGRVQIPGYSVDFVVVAAGIGSAALMSSVGQSVPLVAERGYHIRSRNFGWPQDGPPVVFEDRSVIVTCFRDSLQAASFVEFAKTDAAPDERKWKRLERHIAELGLAMRPPFERWMGSRPTLPDYLPAIGRSERAPNLFYAFGHQHLGLTLGPITGELIADLVDGREPVIGTASFGLGRFKRSQFR